MLVRKPIQQLQTKVGGAGKNKKKKKQKRALSDLQAVVGRSSFRDILRSLVIGGCGVGVHLHMELWH